MMKSKKVKKPKHTVRRKKNIKNKKKTINKRVYIKKTRKQPHKQEHRVVNQIGGDVPLSEIIKHINFFKEDDKKHIQILRNI